MRFSPIEADRSSLRILLSEQDELVDKGVDDVEETADNIESRKASMVDRSRMESRWRAGACGRHPFGSAGSRSVFCNGFAEGFSHHRLILGKLGYPSTDWGDRTTLACDGHGMAADRTTRDPYTASGKKGCRVESCVWVAGGTTATSRTSTRHGCTRRQYRWNLGGCLQDRRRIPRHGTELC